MSSANPHWQATLELGFSPRANKTVLSHRKQHGPLTVQRVFYPEDGVAHLYVLHPPSGIVSGDALGITAQCSAYAHALLTTPAAGKFYRSHTGTLARQTIILQLENHASLEWLPQETLLFGGAEAELNLRIELCKESRLMAWDMNCLGRPESGDTFEQGHARFNLTIEVDQQPLLIEAVQADYALMHSSCGLRGNPVFGALYAYPVTKLDLDNVQALWEDRPDVAATLIDQLLVCRGIASELAILRTEFERAWHLLRPVVIGREACPPRIWAT